MSDALLAKIRSENLSIYQTSAQRLREDIGQEDEIARDYRGRLIYEMIQNADDAMQGGRPARILIMLAPDGLWIANSGRALDEADVRGICGISASTKRTLIGKKRASIGHKGMGFKSVLEISRAPQIYSIGYQFGFDEKKSLQLLKGAGFDTRHAPLMRLPWPLPADQPTWQRLRAEGFTTAFYLPFAASTAAQTFAHIEQVLQSLQVSTFLFLKQLSQIELQLPTSQRVWRIVRERQGPSGWSPVACITDAGLYRVRIHQQAAEEVVFLVAHDGDLEIGDHRGGLAGVAWEDVTASEVSVAVRLVDDRPAPVTHALVHVFLPTTERCPYSFLINGAFSAGLSRQQVQVEPSPSHYNGFLVSEAARLFADTLLPALCALDRHAALMLLQRDQVLENGFSQRLYAELKERLAAIPLIPAESGPPLSLQSLLLPPLLIGVGVPFRKLLPAVVQESGRQLPAELWCDRPIATVLADHGAVVLSPAQAATVLSQADPQRSEKQEDLERGVAIDPVLQVLQRLYESYGEIARSQLVAAVRALPLLPVDAGPNGRWRREVIGKRSCFYPPQYLRGEVPLPGLCFLAQEICWGALNRLERQEVLKQEMVAWQGLFGVQEFKFPEVMRESVLPAMAMDQLARRKEFHDLHKLAAICQLSGKSSQNSPLPYERLSSQRQLFNLARLELPCRGIGDTVRWISAYRVYFGRDWIEEDSVEPMLDACRAAGVTDLPEVPFLIGPEHFVGLLQKYGGLSDAATDSTTEEISLNEDEDKALPVSERERWLEFFRWLGVSAHLRAVHFHDVEDRDTGWLTTEGLRRPQGWSFRHLSPELWSAYFDRFYEALRSKEPVRSERCMRWFYELHDMEHLDWLLYQAERDQEGRIGRSLCQHLSRHWASLSRLSYAWAALTESNPRRRGEPKRAYENERVRCNENLWLFRLRQARFCPTTHGPRAPQTTWQPGREIERRFGQDSRLLPVLEVELPRAMIDALGMRTELTPSVFTLDDAEVLLTHLEALSKQHPDPRRCLRELVRPTCRHLMELLVGRQPTEKRTNVRLPAIQADQLVWLPASMVFFAERRRAHDLFNLPVFVLEAEPRARAPLQTCFGVRLLEESLVWEAIPGDLALDGIDLQLFRDAIWSRGPAMLARLGAERQEERQVAEDAKRLRVLLRGIMPVSRLEVRCTLDGQPVGEAQENAASFVDRDNPNCAFVRWSEAPWPPLPEDAERLAEALCQGFGPNWYEPFLALIQAPDEASRLRLLRRAEAPSDLEEYRRRLEALPEEPVIPVVLTTPRSIDAPSQPPPPSSSRPPEPEKPLHPLWSIDHLRVFGQTVSLESTRPPTDPDRTLHEGTSGGHGGRGGNRTDLKALDQLGMQIAMAFERERLARAGGGQVFDVSSPAHIQAAWGQLQAVFTQQLLPHGLSAEWPGFDLLSLGPNGEIDRLIELKSSGVAARIQECTWNEWKSAANSALRSRYFLYLVGNLRADLSGQAPYIRTVQDPFEQLRADVQTQTRVERKILLSVHLFKRAEEEQLTVHAP